MRKTKKCFKCGVEKELDDFYKHPQMGDGHLNKCKECTKKDTAARLNYKMKDESFRIQERARQRGKYYRLGYKDKHKPTPKQKKKQMERFNEKFPEKKKARSMTSHLKPKNTGNHLHHWSYRDEHLKEVIELKPINHYQAHRFLEYDQINKMFRSVSGELLDSKMKHLRYLVEYKYSA